MLLRFDAELNGRKFSELAKSIILTDIVELPAEEEKITSNRALHAGTHVTDIIRRTLPIQLNFVIRERDPQRRAGRIALVTEWVGAGGTLSISTRPGYTLRVKPDRLPSLGSSLKWTEELSLVLTAYEVPYWLGPSQSVSFNIQTYDSDKRMYYGTQTVYVGSDLPYVTGMLMVVNLSDSYLLTRTRIETGASDIEIREIKVVPGSFVSFGNDADGDFTITMPGETNLLKYRTPTSSDDLLLKTNGNYVVTIYADEPAQAMLTIQTRWKS